LKEKSKAQNAFLLFASYFFYGYADLKMLPLLIVTTLVYYYLGLGISHFKVKGNKNAGLLISTIGIIFGVILLLYFKYLNFFVASFSEMFNSIGLQTNVQTFNIILPIGISFIIFRLIGYVIEVNRGTIEPTRNIVTFSTFVAFFPCLLSGPIDRPQKFIPQLEKKRPFNYEMAVDGLRQILWGMFKKMVIADNLSPIINGIWADYSNQAGSTLFLAAILYTFQIYADFSGYSDMAIGVAKILGFNVAKNFDYPYFSRNISEFWRKWHMSLTSWLTDYIYIPLGGNRCSKSRHFFNTMVVFTICGLWHGANWTFILWGIYNGLLFLPLVLRKKKKLPKVAGEGRLLPNAHETLNILGTFFLATFGWIIFRSASVHDAFLYIKEIFSISLFSMPNIRGFQLLNLLEGFLAIAVLILFEWVNRRNDFGLQSCGKSKAMRWAIYLILSFVCFLFFKTNQPFIYFQF